MSTDLTYRDVQNILKIIDEAEHLDEIELVYGGFRLYVLRNGAGGGKPIGAPIAAPVEARKAPPAAPAPAAPAATVGAGQSVAQVPVPEDVVAIRAPMIGTFYRAPAPGEKPFVEEGQRVRADDTVCLIEVMKLFNSVRAGVDGIVTKILAGNGSLVEFNQPLIFIAPSDKDG
jgi:acetyl-CoA carboxylase biotin carboxyl carrier protein